MTKLEVLELLADLLRKLDRKEIGSDACSFCVVDADDLMFEIDKEIRNERRSSP